MSNIVRVDQIRTLFYSSITSTYFQLGVPFAHAMRVLKFFNDTNGYMMISFDGITDNLFLAPGAFTLYDLTSDQDMSEHFRYQNNTQIWVRYITAPTLVSGTTNTVYLEAIYGKGE